MNQTNDDCQEAKCQRLRKCSGRMAVLQLILYIRIRGEDIKRVHSGRLGKQEKTKWGDLRDWIKRKRERHILLLHWWVQDS